MNFLWCEANYISNHLFDASQWIMMISLFVFFIFTYVASCKLVKKLVKNKVLMILLDILLFLILVFSYIFLLVVILAYSETLVIEDPYSFGIFIGYDEYKYCFRFRYLVMGISLLLNFVWIYYYIFKRYLSKIKNNLIKKKKKKYGLLIYLLINVLSIGLLFGGYFILDNVAEDYDYYRNDFCRSE